MVRKSNTKRKGIAQGFQKRVTIISRRQNNGGYSWLTSSIKSHFPVTNFTKVTESLIHSFLRLSIALHVLPLEQLGNGRYAVPTGLRALPFCSYKLLTLLIIVHRIGVSVTLCLTQDITPPVLLTVIYSISLGLTWIVSVWNPADTALIWSNMESLMDDLSRIKKRKFRRYDQLGLCVEVLSILLLIPTVTVCGAVANGVLYGGLPASWFRSLQPFVCLNMKPDNIIWWLIMFLPLEAVTLFGMLLTPAFVCIMAITTLKTMKTYGEELRRMEIVDLDCRNEVERLFVGWQVCARLTNDWFKLITVPGILGIAAASTMFLFLTIRFTNVPFLLYIFGPIIASTFLLLLALFLYEAVSVTQTSQQVLSEKLLSFDHCNHLRWMLKGDRKKLTLRAKAFKPLAIPIGPFTDIKYAVMADIWEEILNQLLFLLAF